MHKQWAQRNGEAMQLLLRVDEAAKALGVSRSQVYVLIARGELDAVTIGRSRRVPVDAVQAFIERLRHEDFKDAC